MARKPKHVSAFTPVEAVVHKKDKRANIPRAVQMSVFVVRAFVRLR